MMCTDSERSPSRGRFGRRVGMETFEASAPLKELQKKFGFTPEHVVAAAKQQIAGAK